MPRPKTGAVAGPAGAAALCSGSSAAMSPDRHRRPLSAALSATLSATLSAALGCVGCVGPSRAEAEPVEVPPAAAAVASQGGREDATAPVSEAGRADEAEAPAPEAVPAPKEDSKIPAHARVIDPKVQPGLAQFAADLPRGGALWIGPLAGNGGRDVVVWIPPKADAAADLRLVYHFHGTHSEHIERKAPGVPKKKWVGWDRLQQTIDAANELQASRPYNVALVYPFSAGKRPEPGHKGWFNKDYDRIWMAAGESFDELHAQVVEVLTAELGVHPSRIPERVLAEGHSAGGMPLYHIAASGTRLVEEYLFLDASFQGWGDGCWKALQDARSDAMVTMVVTKNGIADPFGKRDPWCTRLETEAALHATHERDCTRDPKTRVPGTKATCEELAASAEEWRDYEAWCAGMKVDMKGTPGARVLRTRVVHGDQPRHFTGGLELPESF
jgi:hypothetical protein